MDYTRIETEKIVLGTLLNDNGSDGFYRDNENVLKPELFTDRQAKFVFGILKSMYEDGCVSFTPYDVLSYAQEHKIRYGNALRFADYMIDISQNYAFKGFKIHLRKLVEAYVNDKRYGKKV